MPLLPVPLSSIKAVYWFPIERYVAGTIRENPTPYEGLRSPLMQKPSPPAFHRLYGIFAVVSAYGPTA